MSSDDPNPPAQTRASLRSSSPMSGTSLLATPALSGAVIAMGILSIILGIIVLVWPEATLLVIAVLFGIELIVLGALRIFAGTAAPAEPSWLKPVTIVLGVLTVAAGIAVLVWPKATLFVLAIFLAVGWIADGIAALVAGFGADRTAGARTFLIISGVVSVIAGLVVMFFPASSLVVLARLGGILLIIVGIAQVVAALMARRQASSTVSTA